MEHMRVLAVLLAWGVVVGMNPCFAQDAAPKKAPEPSAAPATPTGAPPKPAAAERQTREPFNITREFEARMEEVEPPEIEVTGIFRAKGKTVAMARLSLDKVEGRVLLQPGMRVSIPKPDRESSESERWMTYFTVREINSGGMVIVLENGETVWYPVMGELD
jgi:hypothetical protein